MSGLGSLLIRDLLAAYRARALRPTALVEALLERHQRSPELHAWIVPPGEAPLFARARALEALAAEELPLYGIPFAIKDNLDWEGAPTTAGCPGFAYRPSRSAPVVERLLAAGAMVVGKTNLDQFATGLTGARSPYGSCRNPFDASYIAGGSSSGSAVAVAVGLASFALGSDTAGSGRVPAAFNNLVGLKPTRGRLSSRGLVPACRSLDCVSILALTAADAARVLAVAEGFDEADPFARRPAPARRVRPIATEGFSFGVPREADLEFFGDREYARLFREAVDRLAALGGRPEEVDLGPFLEGARLLYEGPWLAERYASVGEFASAHPEECLPVTRAIITGGALPSAVDAFRAQYRLAELRRESESAWQGVDVLVTPTAGTIYRLEEVERDPLGPNARLGRYTQFVNLFDLSAVVVPAGFRADGLPFGVTLLGQAWEDEELLVLAHRLHRAGRFPLGALGSPFPEDDAPPARAAELLELAVCGAHMQGLPLAHELESRGARFLARTRTAPSYRLYALPGGPPARPGLVRVATGGTSIEVEVWAVPLGQVGRFLKGVPAPLSVGQVELEDGRRVSGFICEGVGVAGARDVSGFGGWRTFLAEARP